MIDEGSLEGEACLWCGELAVLDIFEYWPEDRSFMLETCCLASHEYYCQEMESWTPEEWQEFFASRAGVSIRGVGGDVARRDELGIHPADVFTVDRGITLVRSAPIGARLRGKTTCGALSRDEIREYVRLVHSHAGAPPAGMFWGYAVFNGPPADPIYDGRPRFSSQEEGRRPLNLVRWPDTLIGVAMVGRPGARMTQKKAKERGVTIAEVSRVALDHTLPRFLTHKAASEVYVSAYAEACRRGYEKVQTFTLASETGMSLRYARYKRVGESRGGQADRATRRRQIRSAELAQPKVRWERLCSAKGVA